MCELGYNPFMGILFARLEHRHNAYHFLYNQVDHSSNEEYIVIILGFHLKTGFTWIELLFGVRH